MISLLLLLVLAWGFYIGYRRGLLLQAYYLISALASAFVAGQFYKGLGEQFHLLLPYANPQEGQGTFFFPSDQLFQLDKVFYAGIGYLLVFGIVYSIGRLLGLLLHLLPSKKLGGKLFQVSAGILSMLVTLFVLQMALTILAASTLRKSTRSSMVVTWGVEIFSTWLASSVGDASLAIPAFSSVAA